jgi:23S rRNA pseudouridine955/2504/2580 synthase
MISLSIDHSADAGQRLDRFVRKYLPNAPLSAIFKMLRTGKIKVGWKKKDQTYKLEIGDEVTFWLTDSEIEQMKWATTSIEILAPKFSEKKTNSLEILYEDELIMVINKTPGINVHPGDHKTTELSVIDLVQDYLKGKYDSLTFRPALVHRIDRDTSWCLLIAKDKWALEFLLRDLQSHSMEKIYHAIVVNVPIKKQDTIRARLLRIENAKNEAKVRVDEAGQSAITHYNVLKTNSGAQLLSLLECRIETGRTHQIRVHMAFLWNAILWDKAYGDKWVNSYAKRNFDINRQMLHARSLTFTHPKTWKKMTIEAPYPDDFLRIFPL